MDGSLPEMGPVVNFDIKVMKLVVPLSVTKDIALKLHGCDRSSLSQM